MVVFSHYIQPLIDVNERKKCLSKVLGHKEWPRHDTQWLWHRLYKSLELYWKKFNSKFQSQSPVSIYLGCDLVTIKALAYDFHTYQIIQ